MPNQLHFTVELLESSSHRLFLSNIVANGRPIIESLYECLTEFLTTNSDQDHENLVLIFKARETAQTVLKTEAVQAPCLYIRLSRNIAGLLFVKRASDVVLLIFDKLGSFCGTRGRLILGGGPLVAPRYIKPSIISKIERTMSLALIMKI